MLNLSRYDLIVCPSNATFDENDVDIEGSVGNLNDTNSVSQSPSKRYNQLTKANNGSTISVNEFGSVASGQKNEVSATDADQSKMEKEVAVVDHDVRKRHSEQIQSTNNKFRKSMPQYANNLA